MPEPRCGDDGGGLSFRGLQGCPENEGSWDGCSGVGLWAARCDAADVSAVALDATPAGEAGVQLVLVGFSRSGWVLCTSRSSTYARAWQMQQTQRMQQVCVGAVQHTVLAKAAPCRFGVLPYWGCQSTLYPQACNQKRTNKPCHSGSRALRRR